MKIHCIQHETFEKLYCIEDWINKNGYELTTTQMFNPDYKFPRLSEFDWLIIMGGRMNVDSEKRFLWLKDEKKFIAKSIDKGKVVLGICLGAQLIANHLGAKVYKQVNEEVGFYPIYRPKETAENEFTKVFPVGLKVFHWHKRTFDMPYGANHIAYSEGTNYQAFEYEKRIFGLQFHLELNKEAVLEMYKNLWESYLSDYDLEEEPYMQREEEAVQYLDSLEESNKIMISFLDEINKANS